MSESDEPSRKPGDITRLLYKAVRGLPEEEQAEVLEYFLGLGIGAQRPATGHLWPVGGRALGELPGATFVTAHKGAGPNQQIIPVRLSEESHRRLKEWCVEHNFHMSVVVRGLIERFLDGWQEPGTGGAAAAAG